MNKKRIILCAAWIFLITLIGLFLWEKYQQQQISQTQNEDYHKWLEKKEKPNEKNNNWFIFQNKESTLFKEGPNYFPKEKTKIVKTTIQENWNINSYLDIFWPKWKEYYEIDDKNLQNKIKTKNIIYFTIKKTKKHHWQRTQFNLKILQRLNIDKTNLKVSQTLIDQLLIIIRNPKYHWGNLKNFLEENFTNKQSALILQKIKHNTWKFEWNDYEPELY